MRSEEIEIKFLEAALTLDRSSVAQWNQAENKSLARLWARQQTDAERFSRIFHSESLLDPLRLQLIEHVPREVLTEEVVDSMIVRDKLWPALGRRKRLTARPDIAHKLFLAPYIENSSRGQSHDVSHRLSERLERFISLGGTISEKTLDSMVSLATEAPGAPPPVENPLRAEQVNQAMYLKGISYYTGLTSVHLEKIVKALVSLHPAFFEEFGFQIAGDMKVLCKNTITHVSMDTALLKDLFTEGAFSPDSVRMLAFHPVLRKDPDIRKALKDTADTEVICILAKDNLEEEFPGFIRFLSVYAPERALLEIESRIENGNNFDLPEDTVVLLMRLENPSLRRRAFEVLRASSNLKKENK